MSPVPFSYYMPSLSLGSYAPDSPRGGPVTGGTAIYLTGTDFLQTTSAVCRFGAYIAPLTVLNSTAGTCVSPPVGAAAAPLPLEIALNSVNFTSSGLLFHYYNITDVFLDVSRGPASGSTVLFARLSGSGSISYQGSDPSAKLYRGGSLLVAGVGASTVLDPAAPAGYSLTFSSPSALGFGVMFPSTFEFELSLNRGAQSLPRLVYEYYASPEVNAIVPIGVPADNSAGLVVTLLGSNFISRNYSFCNLTLFNGTSVGIPASFEEVSKSMVVVLPGALSSGPAVVELSYNSLRQFSDSRKTIALFSVQASSPTGSPEGGGTVVSVVGSGFAPSVRLLCRFGSVTSAAAYLSATVVSCLSPPMTAGMRPVDISLDGVSFTNSAARFLHYASPAFSALSPKFGPPTSTFTVLGSTFPSLPSPVPSPLCRVGQSMSTALALTSTSVACRATGGVGFTLVEVAFNGADFGSTSLSFAFFDVISLSPNAGPGGATGSIAVFGQGFAAAAGAWVCRFGNQTVTAVQTSSTLLGCTPPASLPVGSYAFGTAVGAGGPIDPQLQFTSAAILFQVFAPPVLTALSPKGGSSRGSTEVALFGSGFALRSAGALVCRFGAGAAVVATLLSPGSAKCMTPPGFGIVSVDISLNSGADFSSSGLTFTYCTVDSVEPRFGPLQGQTPVTVSGSGFLPGASLCIFGGLIVAPLRFIDSQRVVCASPKSATATSTLVGVTTNSADVEPSALGFAYYLQPEIAAVTPGYGPSDGGTVVVVAGRFPALDGRLTLCYFGSTPVVGLLTSVSVTCSSPVGAGKVLFGVTLNGVEGDAVRPGMSFSYFSVFSMAPSMGPKTGGTLVTLTGDGFSQSMWCRVGNGTSNPLARAAYVSSQTVVCPVPVPSRLLALSAASNKIILTADNMTFAASPGAFAYYDAPVITSFSPASLTSGGGGVTLWGDNFDPSGAVGTCHFGSSLGNITFRNASVAVCIAPPTPKSSNVSVALSFNGQVLHAALMTMNFTSCAPGWYADRDTDPCIACETGSFSDQVGSRKCSVCPSTSYSDASGQSACAPCPSNSVTRGRPTSREACTCAADHFNKTGLPGVPCERCPPGGHCPGSTMPPQPLPGYWSTSQDPFTFLACESALACPGGSSSRCAAGYIGRLCARCADGYFRASGECKPCPPVPYIIIAAFVVFSFAVAILLIRGMPGSRDKQRGSPAQLGYAGTLGIATKYFQVLAVIGRLGVEWPRSVRGSVSVLTTPFTLKISDSLAPECTAPQISFQTKWALTMLLPLFFAGVFTLIYAGARLVSKFSKAIDCGPSFSHRVVNAYLSLLGLGYLTLALTALEPFGCKREVDGSFTLVADPSLECSGGWWRVIIVPASLGVALYIFGLPCLLLWWIQRNRGNLSDPGFAERYGSLYSSYTPDLSYWESVVMAEKVSIAVVGLFFSAYPMFQLVVLQIGFVSALLVYQVKAPYLRNKDNLLHAMLRGCALAVLFAGSLLKANQFTSGWASRAVEVLALVFIFSGTLVVVWSVGQDVLLIRRAKRVSLIHGIVSRFDLLTVHGRSMVARWLQSAGGDSDDLQRRFASTLELVHQRSDSLRSNDDGLLDGIVIVFTYGVFRRDVIHRVRHCIEHDNGREGIVQCFALFGRDCMRDSTNSRVSYLESLHRSVFTSASVSAEQAKPGGAGDFQRALDLMAALYGALVPPGLDPGMIRDVNWLIAFHNLFLTAPTSSLLPSSGCPGSLVVSPILSLMRSNKETDHFSTEVRTMTPPCVISEDSL